MFKWHDKTSETRQCTKCEKIKSLAEFHKQNNGKRRINVRSICKECMSVERRSRNFTVTDPDALKKCTGCNTEKNLSQFSFEKRNKDGVTTRCRECLCVVKNRYRNKPESLAKEELRRSTPEYKEYMKEYLLHYGREYRGVREKRVEQATPFWSDLKEIKDIYKSCRTLSSILGIEMHVDHIIPLRGKNICGLHIPSNLRIISKEENLLKSNKLDEQILRKMGYI